jgi:hypothetical protein
MVNGSETSAAPRKASKRRAIRTDTELLKLCAAWRQANSRYMSVTLRLDSKPDHEWTAAERALSKEVSRAVHQIEERIFDTPAETLAGLKAKAEILAFMGNEMGIPVDNSHGWSLVTDIMGLGGEW